MEMRPKKPRFHDGVQLADNLYLDPRGRPGYYRYKDRAGRHLTFQSASVAEANLTAEEANKIRDEDPAIQVEQPKREQISFHVPLYVAKMERLNPKLKKSSEWKNNKYSFHQFARHFVTLRSITHESLTSWWDDLTFHQQKRRQASFRRWFNWMMGESLLPKIKFNPFTLSDDVARLLVKLEPDKARPLCTQMAFRKIYKNAPEFGYECLQIAMGISAYTTLREGDICSMRFKKNIVDGKLQVVIQKSESQKGATKAARLSWTLSEHPVLKKLIDRARELALINKGCPFVINHTPKRRAWNETKEHICQVLPERLYRMYVEVAAAVGLKGQVFHEIRGLASTLYRIAGHENKEIQNLMAHESIDTTIGYQDPDELPYTEIKIKIDIAGLLSNEK
jgi:integrase